MPKQGSGEGRLRKGQWAGQAAETTEDAAIQTVTGLNGLGSFHVTEKAMNVRCLKILSRGVPVQDENSDASAKNGTPPPPKINSHS